MYIKFDSYSKKMIGPLFRNNEICHNGKRSKTNINLNNVNRLKVTHLYNNSKTEDNVRIDGTDIIIPFSQDIIQTGINEFELTAYMKNGDVKRSQTIIYEVVNSISEELPVARLPRTLEFTEYDINDIRVYPIVMNMDTIETITSSIKFKQYDFGTSSIIVQLMDDNKPLQLNNITVTVSFINSEKNLVIDTIKNESTNVILSSINGIVKISVPDEVMRYSGNVQFEIVIFGTDGRRSTSPRVSFDVVNSILNHEDMDDVENDDRYSILTTLLESVGTLHTNAEKLMKQAETVMTDAEALKVSTEVVKNETIVVKNAAENKIVDCETRMTVIENSFDSMVDGSGIVTTDELNSTVSNLVDSAPVNINTIGKLATSLNNDPIYDTNIKKLINTKSDKHDHPYKSLSYVPAWSEVTNKPTKFDPTTHSHSEYALDSEFKNHITNHPSGGGTNDYNSLINKPGNVTTTSNGFMLSSDKIKIDSIANNANNYIHPDSTTIRHVSDAEKTAWNNKSNFSGNYNDLTNKPTIPTVDVNKSYVDTGLNTKVDKAAGKSLVSDTEITRLSNVSNTIIVDNLNSTSNTSALSANQGKKINEQLVAISENISSTSNNLSSRLTDVETLKTSQNMKYNTDAGYLVVTDTKDGQIENLALQGNTLINLANFDRVYSTTDKIYVYSKYATANSLISGKTLYMYNNTGKKIFVDIYENGTWKRLVIINSNETVKAITLTTTEYFKSIYSQASDGWTIDENSQNLLKSSFVLLDSQLNFLPSYFEGIASVGTGLDKIEVSSVKSDGNLCIPLNLATPRGGGVQISDFNFTNTHSFNFNATAYGQGLDVTFENLVIGAKYVFLTDTDVVGTINGTLGLNTNGDKTLNVSASRIEIIATDKIGKIALKNTNPTGINKFNNVRLVKFGCNENFNKYVSDKKQILYYDSTNKLLPVTALRQWDIVYEQGEKSYYSVGSGKVTLNGGVSESWFINNSWSGDVTLAFYIILNGRFRDKTTLLSDKFKTEYVSSPTSTDECIMGETTSDALYIRISKSKLGILSTDTDAIKVQKLKTWLQANNVTVVYKLATPQIYECVNLDLDSYASETMIMCNSGAISHTMSFEITSHIGNTVSVLKERISGTEEHIIRSNSIISNINSELALKSDKITTYTKTEVNNIVNAKTQIDDNNITTSTVWSSSKIKSELDKLPKTAIGTTFDNSTNGMTATNVQKAIEENKTNISAVRNDLDNINLASTNIMRPNGESIETSIVSLSESVNGSRAKLISEYGKFVDLIY